MFALPDHLACETALGLTYSSLEVSQSPSQLGELWCCDQVVVEILDHDACKVHILESQLSTNMNASYLIFLDTISQGSVDSFRTEIETELPDDQVPSSLE